MIDILKAFLSVGLFLTGGLLLAQYAYHDWFMQYMTGYWCGGFSFGACAYFMDKWIKKWKSIKDNA